MYIEFINFLLVNSNLSKSLFEKQHFLNLLLIYLILALFIFFPYFEHLNVSG